MNYRRLGRSGLQLSEVGLGSWLTFGNAVEAERAAACVRQAYDLGVNFFDTANVYATGAAEELLGRLLRQFPRDSYLLATKCFFPMGEKPNQSGLSRKHIMDQAHASLRRLGADYIDLYQAHRYDTAAPLDETLRAFDDLVRAGKVLYVGVSMWTAQQMMDAHALAEGLGLDRIVSNQPSYSMFRRDIEAEIVPTCRKLGVGQVVFSPLAQGVLTGKYTGPDVPPESRAADPRANQFIHRVLTEENLRRVDLLRPLAAELGMTLSQLALAWCLRLDNVTSVICGATRPEQVAENAAASGKTIPPETLARIEQILQ